MRQLERRSGWQLLNRLALKRLYILLITFVVPVFIVLAFRDPVAVMSASGIIAAVHTPFIVFTALLVNMTMLPKELKPGLFSRIGMLLAGLFYFGFAVLYFVAW